MDTPAPVPAQEVPSYFQTPLLADYRLTFRLHILPFFADKRLDLIKPSDVQE